MVTGLQGGTLDGCGLAWLRLRHWSTQPCRPQRGRGLPRLWYECNRRKWDGIYFSIFPGSVSEGFFGKKRLLRSPVYPAQARSLP